MHFLPHETFAKALFNVLKSPLCSAAEKYVYHSNPCACEVDVRPHAHAEETNNTVMCLSKQHSTTSLVVKTQQGTFIILGSRTKSIYLH